LATNFKGKTHEGKQTHLDNASVFLYQANAYYWNPQTKKESLGYPSKAIEQANGTF
jgi:hypothetical protein